MFPQKPVTDRIETPRMTLRLPHMSDFEAWAQQRQKSAEYLMPWEPRWRNEQFHRPAFKMRVQWAQRSYKADQAYAYFLIRRGDNALLGALTLDNVRRGPSQSGTIGYWIGEDYAGQGYMTEAVEAIVYHAFSRLDLSRVEAACLPENKASRKVLENAGFKYEGVAQSYLQINGRWRTHVLYAHLRDDRRGTSTAE